MMSLLGDMPVPSEARTGWATASDRTFRYPPLPPADLFHRLRRRRSVD